MRRQGVITHVDGRRLFLLSWPKAERSSFKNSKRIAWEHIPNIIICMGISLLLWMQCTHALVQTQPSATSQFHEWWFTKGRYGTSPVCGGIYVHVQCMQWWSNAQWALTDTEEWPGSGTMACHWGARSEDMCRGLSPAQARRKNAACMPSWDLYGMG